MKRILAVLLAVLLLIAVVPATSLAEGASSNGDTSVYHVQTRGNVLHLRSAAGMNSPIISSLTNGTALVKISSKRISKDGYKWINVKTMSGLRGWVADAYVKSNARADVATQTSGLNVRSGRGMNYRIYYSIPHGTRGVTVYKINGNWAYVSWRGRQKGWASLGYLRWARW